MRKPKYHEKKLLKKVNFLEWKRDGGHIEAHVMHRYHVTVRDNYKKFLHLLLNPAIYLGLKMLKCIYNMGMIPSQKSLALCDQQ
uniref:Uncharacterized protein n=1 Tax=Lactuca sativa TaxID=4236 RepID=A0A9R1W9C3_LACSA|nr:hypothetical protein LSAT_V11C300102210 [Lactuca sativa]